MPVVIDLTKYPELVDRIATSIRAQLQDLVFTCSDDTTDAVLGLVGRVSEIAWDVSRAMVTEKHVQDVNVPDTPDTDKLVVMRLDDQEFIDEAGDIWQRAQGFGNLVCIVCLEEIEDSVAYNSSYTQIVHRKCMKVVEATEMIQSILRGLET